MNEVELYAISLMPYVAPEVGVHPVTMMCGKRHKTIWRCCMIAHPETPDQHYFIEAS